MIYFRQILTFDVPSNNDEDEWMIEKATKRNAKSFLDYCRCSLIPLISALWWVLDLWLTLFYCTIYMLYIIGILLWIIAVKTKELREAKYIHIIFIFLEKLKESGCQYYFLLRIITTLSRYVTFTPGAILKTCCYGHHPASVQTEPNYSNHRLELIMAFIICHNHYHLSLFIMIMEWYPKDLNYFF